MNYLKLNHFNDCLSIIILAKIHQEWQGKFLEEIEYPWQIWWKLDKSKLLTEKHFDALPWERAEPQNKTRPVTWLDLLRKLVLELDNNNDLAKNIIIRTSSQKVFTYLVKQHCLLQQGEIFFTSPHKKFPHYLLKISCPSFWCLSLCEEIAAFDIYNEVCKTSNLYLQRGYQLQRQANNHKLNIESGLLVLLESCGNIHTYRPQWKKSTEIIDIVAPKALITHAVNNNRIKIEIQLVKSEKLKTSSLWHVPAKNNLIEILGQTAQNRLHGFKAWFLDTGEIFILAQEYCDSGLRLLFDESFDHFTCYQNKIFIPVGTAFMPELPEEQLLNIFDCKDYLCLSIQDKKTQPLILKKRALEDLEFFIEFCVKRTAEQAQYHQKWQFTFNYLTQNSIQKSKPTKSKTKSNEQQIAQKEQSTIAKKANKLSFQQNKKNEQLQILKELQKIDKQLMEYTADSVLWKQRAKLSYKLNHSRASLIADLTACIIDKDIVGFMTCIQKEQIVKMHQENIKEKEQGDFLGSIRRINIAELYYGLQLYFAVKFNDEDVFRFACTAMKTGCRGTNCNYYMFEDFDTTLEKQNEPIEHFSEEDVRIIEERAHKFMNVVENYRKPLPTIIARQFQILLDSNVGRHNFQYNYDEMAIKEHWEQRWQYLKSYPKYSGNLSSSTEFWHKQVAMKDIRNTSIEQVFTGDIYRPIFTAEFKKEAMKTVENMYNLHLNGQRLSMVREYAQLDKKEAAGIEIDESIRQQKIIKDAKKQRILLYLVTKYGPLEHFKKYIYPFRYEEEFINQLIMNCDIYRLSIMYNVSVDEDVFFHRMIEILPDADVGYSLLDFRDVVENIILCLYLTKNDCQNYFDLILTKVMNWLDHYSHNSYYADELLTLISYLQARIVYFKLSDSVHAFHFYSRKKSLWMDHAGFIGLQGLRPLIKKLEG